MSVGGGLKRFPVRNFSYFRFHNRLIFSDILFLNFDASVIRSSKNVINSDVVTVDLSGIGGLKIFGNMTKDHFSVFLATESGRIVQRKNKRMFHSIFKNSISVSVNIIHLFQALEQNIPVILFNSGSDVVCESLDKTIGVLLSVLFQFIFNLRNYFFDFQCSF
jgi:hypothetical protein